MSAARKTKTPFHKVKDLKISKIRANEENPRLEFPQNELDQLSESLERKGILVPVVVFEDPKRRGSYVLTDGERRYRCAKQLGWTEIPAVITNAKNAEDNLVEMFNIHLVREPWRDMPTAYALKRLIKFREKAGLPSTDEDLSNITGLTIDRLKRFRHAIELPKEYQDHIANGRVPLNFFWELKVNVIDPIAAQRPTLFKELGGDNITSAFVKKRLDEVITDTVALRKVRPIVAAAREDAGEDDADSALDDTLRSLVEDPSYSIQDAFEESVESMIEIGRLAKKCANMVKSFERLLAQGTSAEQRKVKSIGERLIRNLSEALKRRDR